MKRAVLVLVLVCSGTLASVTTPLPAWAAPTTGAFFDSDPGDYIGQGAMKVYVPPSATFTIQTTYSVTDSVTVGWTGPGVFWRATFASPPGTPLVAGTYVNAERAASRSAGRPGLDVTGDGRGCNTLTGTFTIHEITYSGTTPLTFSVHFEQHCEGGLTALFGEVRYNAARTLGGLTIQPRAVTFPFTDSDSASPSQLFTVTSIGPDPESITPSALVGVNPADFEKTSDTCSPAPVAAAASCSIGYRFRPTDSGPRRATLPLRYDGGRGSRDLTLTGTATSSGSKEFFFAEGTVRPGFAEFLTLQNPRSASASATLTFQATDDAGGAVPVPQAPLAVPGLSRVTFNLNDYLGSKGIRTPINISVQVGADRDLVVERPLYFSTGLAGGVDGGTDVIGAIRPELVVSFAEGTVRPGFEEFITIQNPGGAAGQAKLVFQASNDARAPVNVPSKTVSLPARSRATVRLNDHLAATSTPTPINISVVVIADVPVVAERPLYFRTSLAGGVNGGTDVVGTPFISRFHAFAEGTVRPGFAEFVTIQNPGSTAGVANVFFQASNDAGAPVDVPTGTANVPAGSRVTLDINQYLASVGVPTPINLSFYISSDVYLIAERPLYFSSGLAGGVNGGSDVIGAIVVDTDYGFAEGTVRPGFAEFLTIQNGSPTAAGTATLSFQASNDGGAAVTIPSKTVSLSPKSRVTVDINQHLMANGVPTPANVSVRVRTDIPVVAERPLYFRTGLVGGVDGGTDVIGFQPIYAALVQGASTHATAAFFDPSTAAPDGPHRLTASDVAGG